MRSHSTPLPNTPTIPDTTQRLIKRLLTSANNVASASNDDARVAARGFMISRALELCERRNHLLEKLEAGEAYQAQIDATYPLPSTWDARVARYQQIINENPGYAERDEKFAAWQDELAAITYALDEAAETWTGKDKIGEQDIWAA